MRVMEADIFRQTVVSSSTLALHRSPAVFEDPLAYDPGRWLQASPEQLRAMEAHHIPFGYGARLCLGQSFANAEIKLFVACLVLKFKIREDRTSATNAASMAQLGTQNALPRGLRCDISFRRIGRE
jgi:cytochrome P450